MEDRLFNALFSYHAYNVFEMEADANWAKMQRKGENRIYWFKGSLRVMVRLCIHMILRTSFFPIGVLGFPPPMFEVTIPPP